jgi:hypothetical protein
MRVFLSWAATTKDFSDVLESACRSAGIDLDGAPAPGPRVWQGVASRLQQLAERNREQTAQSSTVTNSLASYLENQSERRAPPAHPPADPQSVAAELRITAKMTLADLRRLRREFALANHPDRSGSTERENATRRMMIANMLIDRELKRRRSTQKVSQRGQQSSQAD